MEQVFFGEFEHSLDKQRRVAIPKEWRPQDSKDACFYILPGRGHSIQVMPHRLFMEEVFEKVKKLSYASKKRNLLSQLGRYGQQVSCDKQGRIALSTFLLEHAQLTNCTQVAINGCITTFEIRRPAEVTASEESIDAFLDQLEALEDEVNT